MKYLTNCWFITNFIDDYCDECVWPNNEGWIGENYG